MYAQPTKNKVTRGDGYRLLIKKFSKPTKIKVTMDDPYNNEDQWVYLISNSGNNMAFEDSVFVLKGQKEFYFNKELADFDEGNSLELLFYGKRVFNRMFFITAGDSVQINITRETVLRAFQKAEGSKASEEIDYFKNKESSIIEDIKRIKTSIENTTDEITLTQLNDSLTYYESKLRKDLWLEALNKPTTPTASCWFLHQLVKSVPGEIIDSLHAVLQQRFPNSKEIANFGKGAPPMTKESRQAFMRKKQMLFPHLQYNNSNKPQPVDIKLKEELGKIISYKIGDIIKNIALKGLNGGLVSVFDEKTPYVLIDFWASWCGPCRGENEGLKETLAKHKGLFSVYAISIDDDEKPWKSAIENDKTEVFTHVNVGMKEKEGQIITKQFGVRAIPANFLIDKDHKIIAVNLFGKNLEKTISELKN